MSTVSCNFVATQWPLPTTFRTFWKMVLQRRISIIGLLATEKEGLEEYWPEDEKEVVVIGISEDGTQKVVMTMPECVDDRLLSNTMVRTIQFSVVAINDGEEGSPTPIHTVKHLQFTKWGDFGVPSERDFLRFFTAYNAQLDLLREQGKGDTEQLIHCRAGVGRTGTFVMIQFMTSYVQALRAHGLSDDEIMVNVAQGMWELRQQRVTTVQAAIQYKFVYRAVREICSLKGKE
eukprot:TRINITY_DN745_c0_g1_i7.p1 TRINITY_DN745_c0_g1~~TRINITY_DN745_c0_g1_i7.p1  ORF type:complete len:233 (+),score=71.72 TRINITY_DN745_c0_g1_i7:879-1577(+)